MNLHNMRLRKPSLAIGDGGTLVSPDRHLLDVFFARAHEQPEAEAYAFMTRRDQVTRLTWAEVHERALQLAAGLQARGLSGRNVLLLFPTGLDYVVSFFGCLAAGAVAVPCYPRIGGRYSDRIQALIESAEPGLALIDAAERDRQRGEKADALGGVPMATPAELKGDAADYRRPEQMDPDDLVLLQYTSGSTARPRAAQITHRNLCYTLAATEQALGFTRNEVGFSWLPPYHDMGLIGGILQPFYTGFPVTLMSPYRCMTKPLLWLEAMADLGATCCAAPNFAYDLSVRRTTPAQRAALDLSRWRVAICGAEPIQADTVTRFCDAFADSGFSSHAFVPAYGLAEATLMVSCKAQREVAAIRRFDAESLRAGRVRPADDGRAVVGCGKVLPGSEVVIVASETSAPCADGEVGEIWVAGPGVARGYRQDPTLSDTTFDARLDGFGEQAFMRTGDLGFLDQGELFITGRCKDLIIVRGRNYYPADMEHAVQDCHPLLLWGGCAVFSVPVEGDGGESVVAVLEVARRAPQADYFAMAAKVRAAMTAATGLSPASVVFIKAGDLPKTPSGKVRRQACRQAYRDETLPVLAEISASGAIWAAGDVDVAALPQLSEAAQAETIRDYLRRGLSRLTGRALPASADDLRLGELGMDSMAASAAKGTIEDDLGVSVPIETLLEGSVADVAGCIMAAGVAASADDEVAPYLAPGRYPLSTTQAALWFLSNLEAQGSQSHIARAVCITGRVDGTALEQACSALVARHPALRTTFHDEDGAPYQQVHAQGAAIFRQETALGTTPEALTDQLQALVEAPFDMTQGPLLRFVLIPLRADEAVLLTVAHHIVADLWSMVVILDELLQMLTETVTATTPSRAFPTFAAWERALVASERGHRHRRFWQKELRDLPEKPVLPCSNAATATAQGGSHQLYLDESLVAEVNRTATSAGVTPYAVLLTAYQVMLQRFTGQARFAVGCPVSRRSSSRWVRTVGPAVNLVPVIGELDAGQGFGETLQSMWRRWLQIMEHSDYPFAEMIEGLARDRDASANPVFNLVFGLQQTALGKASPMGALLSEHAEGQIDLDGTVWAPFSLPRRHCQFDFMLLLTPCAGGLAGTIEFRQAAVSAPVVARMASFYKHLLAAINAEVDAPIGLLADRALAKVEQALFAPTTARLPQATGLLHHLFEDQARRTPNAVALRQGATSTTYAELDARANQLAHVLQARGVGPETSVGLYVARSCDMMVAVLGVLKAGGVYVPLDLGHPEQRLRAVYAGAGCRCLVVAAETVPAWCLDLGELVDLRATPAVVTSAPSSAPVVATAADHAAYILFTSGSTGRPKGVVVSHGNAYHLLTSLKQMMSPPSAPRLAAVTTLSFDMSLVELFLPLMLGGSVTIADQREVGDAERLSALVANSDMFQATPATWKMLLAQGFTHSGRLIAMTGGEAADSDMVTRLLESGAEVWNLYGPTEITVYAAGARLTDADITIGQSLPNGRCYVLDAAMRPCPTGTPGELYVAGAGVTRGYVGRADLTAERFLPCPFGPAGARLYRTGDLVRRRENGDLEYLGRMDRQIKVRGFRIEPGEIEAVLCGHPAVHHAVVERRGGDQQSHFLAAHCVLASSQPATPALATALRAFAGDHLPRYMVPAKIQFHDALPLLASGKVDRLALLAMPLDESDPGGAVPRTATEQIVATVWAELLPIQQAYRNDDFFALGGNSLQAVQLTAALSKALQCEIPLAALWEGSTLAELAATCELVRAKAERAPAAPCFAARLPEAGDAPLTPVQQRVWFLEQMTPGTAMFNSVYCGEVAGRLEEGALQAAVNALYRRHDALRANVTAHDGDYVMRVFDREPPTVTVRDFRAAGAEARALAMAEVDRVVAAPFDLSGEVLLRCLLLRLPESDVLAIATHHLVADGFSLDLAFEEMAVWYDVHRGLAVPPPRQAAPQFSDFARWSAAADRDLVRAEQQRAGLQWWVQTLADITPLEVPTDLPRPAVISTRGDWVPLQLDGATSQQLRDVARAHGVTPFMVLLAAWQLLLAKLSQRNDIVVGTGVVNRDQVATHDMIGNFTNLIALRTRLQQDGSVGDLLRNVAAVCRGAQQHHGVPFEQVVAAVEATRDLSRNPVFQALFVMQPEAPNRQIGGLALTRVERGARTALADLELHLADRSAISGRIAFATDLFEKHTVGLIAARYVQLLQAMLADTEQPTRALSILLAADQTRLQQWCFGPRDRSQAPLVHQQLQHWAQQTPDAPALRCGEHQLTYAALDCRANQLAQHLLSLGAAPEMRIGLCLERSIEAVVAIFGILKAGASYLPLDPRYPLKRLQAVVDNSAMALMVTSADLVDKVPCGGVPTVLVDRDEALISAASQQAPTIQLDPENTAYTIYTSGSTGTPKGVQIPHRALANLAAAMVASPGIRPCDVQSSLSSLSFDASVGEMFPPLYGGATLAMLRHEEIVDIERLQAALLRNGTTILQATPTTWRLLENSGGIDAAIDVRFGGEAMPPDLAETLIRRHPTIWQMYGPTETTVWSAGRRPAHAQDLSLGHPIDHTSLHILDSRLQPVPVGCYGELCIGGLGLARGYADRPDLTANAFVPDGVSGAVGARLYRTGDVVRLRWDGSLEFCGRRDDQLKIRGHRIEPGEVVAALLAYPAVKEAVVSASEGTDAEKFLMAHLVPKADAVVAVDALKTFLGSVLPAAAIPSSIVILDEMPRSPNGKIDKKNLPMPDSMRPTMTEDFAKPRNEREQTLADIWQNALGLDRVGRNDDFFALGGDSIRALHIVEKARLAGFALRVQDVFQKPSVARLAETTEVVAQPQTIEPFALLAEADRDWVQSEAPALEDAFPVAMLQAGMLFHSMKTPNSATYHQVLTMSLALPFDAEGIQAAVDAVVARRPALRLAFASTGISEPLQLVHRQASLPVGFHDLRALSPTAQEETLAAWLEQERFRPFDVTRPPLLRLHVHRRDDAQLQLTFCFHHAVLDGWSVALMLRELLQCYRARLSGAPNVLAPVNDRSLLAQQINAERAALADTRQRDYWATQVSRNAGETLWGEQPNVSGEVVPACRRMLPTDAFAALGKLAGEWQVGLSSLLLAVHARVVAAMADRETVVSGWVSQVRPETAGAGEALGMFLNTLPVPVSVSTTSWRSLVTAVDTSLRDLQPHRRYPTAQMVRDAQGAKICDNFFYYTDLQGQGGGDERRQPELSSFDVLEQNELPLTVSVHREPNGDRLSLRVLVDPHACPLAADQVAARYLQGLARLLAEPNGLLAADDLWCDDERADLAAMVAAADNAHPQQLVPQRFRQQALATPDQVALSDGTTVLTYAALQKAVDGLAAALVQRGFAAEQPVAVVLPRTTDLVVALLATLQAGLAYVPLDPRHPFARNADIVREVGAACVITDAETAPAWRELLDHVVTPADAVATTVDAASLPAPAPSDTAYIIFTSGSTGKPKGVVIEHAALAQLMEAMISVSGIGGGDTLAAVTTVSFDIAAVELFMPLLVGARVVLVAPETAADGELLAERLIDATMMQATPATWRLLTAQGWTAPEGFTILCGGEALPADLGAALAAQARTLNLYGPTEAAIWSSVDTVTAGEPMTIGRALPGRSLLVLDRRGHLVPVGGVGELVIGGIGLARGYWQREALTAQQFIENPYGGEGSRLYRTGDLVRRLADGRLAYLGRLDRQIKLRGYRIEPGEIEHALSRHAGVAEAVVVVDQPGRHGRLTAHVVRTSAGAAQEPQTLIENLRHALAAELPAYMVPVAYTFLDAVPRLVNGKVDYRALPQSQSLVAQPSYTPPQTETETAIAGLWGELLGVAQVGADDDFFEIGGDSVSCAAMITALEARLHVKPSVQLVLQHPTVRGLAAVVDGELAIVHRVQVDEGQRLQQSLEQLSDAQIAALLNDPMLNL